MEAEIQRALEAAAKRARRVAEVDAANGVAERAQAPAEEDRDLARTGICWLVQL